MSLRLKWSLLFLLIAASTIGLLAPIALHVQRAGLVRAETELEAAVVDEASRSVANALEGGALATRRTGEIPTDARIGGDEGRLALAFDVVASASMLDDVVLWGADGERFARLRDALRVKRGR